MEKRNILNPEISVLGCGWLGLDLAKTLIQSGYTVKGSTTTESKLKLLQEHSIDPFLIDLTEKGISGNLKGFLKNSDIIIIAIPPGLRKNPDKNHVREISYFTEALETSSIKNLIYISSTSVFKDSEDMPVITSKTIPNNTSNIAKQLITIEDLMFNLPHITSTILRFSGLIGENRHPAHYLQGRKNIQNPDAPINLIHKKDCIAIIEQIIEQKVWGRFFNASHPSHPEKKSYYTNYCLANDLEPPLFVASEKSKGKIIDSSYLAQTLNYSFKITP